MENFLLVREILLKGSSGQNGQSNIKFWRRCQHLLKNIYFTTSKHETT